MKQTLKFFYRFSQKMLKNATFCVRFCDLVKLRMLKFQRLLTVFLFGYMEKQSEMVNFIRVGLPLSTHKRYKNTGIYQDKSEK